ncbi:hypothetical protein [Pigmentiphaga litoralis]|uniref:hypothetical protein n=1 Tax=Pigmentiphaga litoralis TaxID=516702 RepID=UPI003B42C0B3
MKTLSVSKASNCSPPPPGMYRADRRIASASRAAAARSRAASGSPRGHLGAFNAVRSSALRPTSGPV